MVKSRQILLDHLQARKEPTSDIYVTSSTKMHDCRIIMQTRTTNYRRPSKADPLISPHKVSEQTKLDLMGPRRREEYMRSKVNRAKKRADSERFLCSVILTRPVHDALQHFAMEKNLTYNEAVFRCVNHCMSCFAEPAREEEEDE